MGAKRKQVVKAEQAMSGTAETGAWVLVGAAVMTLVSQFLSSSQAEAVDAGACVLVAAAVIAAGLLVVTRETHTSSARLAVAWSGLLVWLTVSTLASGRVWSAFAGEANYLTGLAALLALTLITSASRAHAQGARRVLVIISPWVLLGEIVWVGIQLATGLQPGGSLPNSTYLGEALLLLLPWVLVKDAPIALPRATRLGLAVATIVTLGASGSRVAAAVALAWFAIEVIGRSSLARATRIWVTAGAVCAVVAAGLVFARAEILGSTGVDSLGERPAMWSIALRAVAEAPVLGYGPDGFTAGGSAVVTPALAAAGDVVTFRPGAGDPHNLLLWFALSGGLVALALLLWFGGELVLRWRQALSAGVDVTPAAWGVAGATIVFLTAPAAIEVLPLLGVVAGVSLAIPDGAPAKLGRLATAARRAVPILVGMVCLAYAANAAVRYPLESTGPDTSPGKAEAARSAMRIWSMDPHLAFLASLHLGYVAASDPVVASQRPDLVAIRRAAQLDAHNPFYALEVARTLKFYRQPGAEVERAFEATFERYPAYPLARAEYAAFLAEQGRLDEAAKQVAIAKLVPDEDPGRLGAIQAAERLISAGAK